MASEAPKLVKILDGLATLNNALAKELYGEDETGPSPSE